VSRIEPRRLLLLGAAALLLRLGCAAATEWHPLFPDYYYTDPQVMEQAAVTTLEMRRQGRPYRYQGTLSQRIQVEFLLRLYGAVGHRPFAAKLVNALAGAAGAVVLAAALAPAFGAAPALAAGALAAAWPSGVFFTAHNFKEAPTNLFAYLSLWGLMLLLAESGLKRTRAAALAAGAGAALIVCGFYRAYVMLALCFAFGAAFAWSLLRQRRASAGLVGGLLVCAASPALYAPLADAVMRRGLSATGGTDSPYTNVQLIPLTNDEFQKGVVHRPTSPEGLSGFRKSRLHADRRYALEKRGRTIGTQIFPDAEFRNWADVALYLPKGLFHVLFMPLPGLFPTDGKLGRLAASWENAALLALCLAGLLGLARGPKTPVRAAPVLFCAIMAGGAALLEFDLGSASRHKLLFLPMLFPFAAEELLRRRRA
jgi:hypothetical protein